jgi:hypothetical protein
VSETRHINGLMPGARIQSARSACLFFHLKLRKMLRRQNNGCLHKRARPHEAGFRSSARVGSSIWKVEPSPSVDSTQMRPPCISTICLAMTSAKRLEGLDE